MFIFFINYVSFHFSVWNEKLIKVDNNLTDNCVKLMGRTCEIAKCVKPSPPPPSTVNMCNTLGKKNIGCLNNVITREMWNNSVLCRISNVNCESSCPRQKVKQEVKRVEENELKKKNEKKVQEEELQQKQQQKQQQEQKQQQQDQLQQEQKKELEKQQRHEQQYQKQQQQERHKQQQQQLRQQRPLDSEEDFLINGPPQIMINDLNYIKMVSTMLNNLNRTFLKVRPHDGGLRKEKYEEKIKNARQALARSVNDLLMKIDEICEIKTEGVVVFCTCRIFFYVSCFMLHIVVVVVQMCFKHVSLMFLFHFVSFHLFFLVSLQLPKSN